MYAPARVRPGPFAPASLPTTGSNPTFWGARQLFRKSRCADRGNRTRGARRDRARHRRARMRRLRRARARSPPMGSRTGRTPVRPRAAPAPASHARRHVRLRRRLSQRILRRRRLLQHGLHRNVHGLQRPGIAGDLHVRSRGRRAARAEPMSRVGRIHLRPRRHVRRQRRLPQPRRGHGVQGRRVLGRGAVVGVNVCDGQGRCKAGPATICAPFNCDPATNACVGDLPVRTPIASPASRA